MTTPPDPKVTPTVYDSRHTPQKPAIDLVKKDVFFKRRNVDGVTFREIACCADMAPTAADCVIFETIQALTATGSGGGGGGGGGGGVGGPPGVPRPPYDSQTGGGGGGGLFTASIRDDLFQGQETNPPIRMLAFNPPLPVPVPGTKSSVNVGGVFSDTLTGTISNWGGVVTPAHRVAIFQLLDNSYLRAFLTLSITSDNADLSTFHDADIVLDIALGLTRPPTTDADLRDIANWKVFKLTHTYRSTHREVAQSSALTFTWTIPSSAFVSIDGADNTGLLVTIFAIADSEKNVFVSDQILDINAKFFLF
jgi:hypothetical protein